MKFVAKIFLFFGICYGCFVSIENSDGRIYRATILELERDKAQVEGHLETSMNRNKELRKEVKTLQEAIASGSYEELNSSPAELADETDGAI